MDTSVFRCYSSLLQGDQNQEFSHVSYEFLLQMQTPIAIKHDIFNFHSIASTMVNGSSLNRYVF